MARAKGCGVPSHHLGNATAAAGRLGRSCALYGGEVALSRHFLENEAA